MATMTIEQYQAQLLRWRKEAEYDSAVSERKERGNAKQKRPGQFRKGKTRRDVANGCQVRNESNKAARREWNNTSTLKRTHSNFPWHTCNGKRNRIRITGVGGKTILLDVQAHPSMR